MTDKQNLPRFLKTPLSNSLHWQDVPLNLEGRVIVKRRSGSGYSEGGIVTPDGGARRVMGVAWVVRATGAAANHLHPGDSVISPETSINNGLQFPCENGELDDFREFDARDVYHVLPFDDAAAWYDEAAKVARAEVVEAIPQIKALADGDDCLLAKSWIERLKGKGELYELYDLGTIEDLDAAAVNVSRVAAEHAQRKQREKEAAEAEAKEQLARERQAAADRRNREGQ